MLKIYAVSPEGGYDQYLTIEPLSANNGFIAFNGWYSTSKDGMHWSKFFKKKPGGCVIPAENINVKEHPDDSAYYLSDATSEDKGECLWKWNDGGKTRKTLLQYLPAYTQLFVTSKEVVLYFSNMFFWVSYDQGESWTNIDVYNNAKNGNRFHINFLPRIYNIHVWNDKIMAFELFTSEKSYFGELFFNVKEGSDEQKEIDSYNKHFKL